VYSQQGELEEKLKKQKNDLTHTITQTTKAQQLQLDGVTAKADKLQQQLQQALDANAALHIENAQLKADLAQLRLEYDELLNSGQNGSTTDASNNAVTTGSATTNGAAGATLEMNADNYRKALKKLIKDKEKSKLELQQLTDDLAAQAIATEQALLMQKANSDTELLTIIETHKGDSDKQRNELLTLHTAALQSCAVEYQHRHDVAIAQLTADTSTQIAALQQSIEQSSLKLVHEREVSQACIEQLQHRLDVAEQYKITADEQYSTSVAHLHDELHAAKQQLQTTQQDSQQTVSSYDTTTALLKTALVKAKDKAERYRKERDERTISLKEQSAHAKSIEDTLQLTSGELNDAIAELSTTRLQIATLNESVQASEGLLSAMHAAAAQSERQQAHLKDAASDEAKSYISKMTVLENRLLSETAAFTEVTGKVKLLEQQLHDTVTELGGARGYHAKAESRIIELEAAVHSEQLVSLQHKQQLDTLQAAHDAVQQQISSVQTEHASTVTEHITAQEQLRNELNEANVRLTQLSSDIEQHKSTNSEQQATLVQLQQALAAAESDSKHVNMQLQGLEIDCETSKRHTIELQDALTAETNMKTKVLSKYSKLKDDHYSLRLKYTAVEAELSAASTLVSECRNSVSTSTQESSTLTLQLRLSDAHRIEIEQQLQSLKQQLQDVTVKCVTANEQIIIDTAQHKQELESVTAALTESNAQVVDRNAQLTASQQQVVTLQQQLDALEMSRTALQDTYDTAQAASTLTIQQLQHELDSATTELKSASQQRDDVQQQLRAVQHELQTVTADHTRSNEQTMSTVQSLETQLHTTVSERDTVSQQYSTLQASCDKLDSQLLQQFEAHDLVCKELHTTQQDLTHVRDECESKQADIVESIRSRQAVEAALHAATTETEQLRLDVQASVQHAATLQVTVNTSASKLIQLQQTSQQYEAQCNDLRTELNSVKATLSDAQTKLDAATSQCQTLQAQLQSELQLTISLRTTITGIHKIKWYTIEWYLSCNV
jgi:DNA repair exonuclease SbcCD ATPase subunit/regulator of replication initiation timing